MIFRLSRQLGGNLTKMSIFNPRPNSSYCEEPGDNLLPLPNDYA